MGTTTNTSTPWRRLIAIVLGAGAIAIGGVPQLAATAYAQPNNGGSESEGHKECREAGGDFSSGTDAGGNSVESCCYEGLISGVTHCDVWVNGKWDKDKSFREEPPAAPPQVGGPPKVGGTPELSPDAQGAPKNPPRATIPGQAQVALR